MAINSFPKPGSGINRAGESARTHSTITKLLKNQTQPDPYLTKIEFAAARWVPSVSFVSTPSFQNTA